MRIEQSVLDEIYKRVETNQGHPMEDYTTLNLPRTIGQLAIDGRVRIYEGRVYLKDNQCPACRGALNEIQNVFWCSCGWVEADK